MQTNKHTLLIGRGTIAVNCLDILDTLKELPKIIICDSQDTGKDTWTKSLYKRAKELGYKEDINLFKETRVNKPEFIEKIKVTGIVIDIIFSIQPYAIFREPFISLARDYVVNLHMAPLPKLRGVSPIPWAFIDNLEEMGVTLHLIQNAGVDNGPIIFQVKFPIKDKDNSWTLFQKCVNNGTQLFAKHVKQIINGDINPQPQDESEVTYHPIGEMDFSQLEINLNQDITTVFNFIRSRIFPIFQLPYIIYNGKKIRIKDVHKQSKTLDSEIMFRKGKYYIPYESGTLVLEPEE